MAKKPKNDETALAAAGEPLDVNESEKRTAKSDRQIIDTAGAVVEDWQDARGFRYKSTPENFTVELRFDGEGALPQDIVYGLAAFGGLTLAGNVANTIRNGKQKEDPSATEQAALEAWVENLKAGNWTSPRGEVVAGVTLLAEAYVAAKAKVGQTIDLAETIEKLKNSDKAKRATVRTNPAVVEALAQIKLDRARAAMAAKPTTLIEL